MATSSVTAPLREPDSAVPAPKGLWCTAVFYALLALSPIPRYYFLRGALPDEQWAGTSPFDAYLRINVVYLGSAAACSLLLFRRSRHAVWPAALVVLWVAYWRAVSAWSWLHGRPVSMMLPFEVLWLLVFGVLLISIVRLRKQGVLR